MIEERQLGGESYIPSTVERKRAIAGLFFVGVIMMLAVQRELSVFERYYLSLALSLWTLGLILFFVSIIVAFVVPLLGYLFVLVLLVWFVIWAFALQQAWAGLYNSSFVVMKILAGLGEWLLSLFGDDNVQG